jgi:hypothetical protein
MGTLVYPLHSILCMALPTHFSIKHALLLVMISLTACQSPAVKKYPYLIKVQIKGCQEPTGKLFRLKALGLDLLDSAKLEQGQLVLRGMVEHPGVYKVFCHCGNNKTSNLDVYLPADSVEAVVMPGANQRPDIYQPAGLGPLGIGSYLLDTRLFSTARQQREVESYLLTNDSIWNKFFLDRNRYKAKMDAAISAGHKPEIDRWADSARHVQENFPNYLATASAQFIKQHPHTQVGIFALLSAGNDAATAKRLTPYYQAMPLAWQRSFFGKAAAERLHTIPATAEAK